MTTYLTVHCVYRRRSGAKPGARTVSCAFLGCWRLPADVHIELHIPSLVYTSLYISSARNMCQGCRVLGLKVFCAWTAHPFPRYSPPVTRPFFGRNTTWGLARGACGCAFWSRDSPAFRCSVGGARLIVGCVSHLFGGCAGGRVLWLPLGACYYV